MYKRQGNKTAQRLIIELKDKLSLEDAFEQKLSHTQEAVSGNGLKGIRNEAVEAAFSYIQRDVYKRQMVMTVLK